MSAQDTAAIVCAYYEIHDTAALRAAGFVG